ncbi:flagella synthesis protein FlgN [Pseudohalioglobus lutimaris]|uniref:Flagellar protein FlgN n=1 Tax=Pseudohalioglobus lutimaris TaxID=1737061 RepID=A0A2N5X1S1_9GAMM|nr:flagellar protein FlgN [Pseudohalioglobus lutimaris]PLW68410.1 flagellar protein FlgN [Pseudohalioglobus lutimaris]
MDPGQSLLSLIDQEVASLEALHKILLQEHQALLAADVPLIETLTANKNQALDKQSDITRQRQLFTEQHAKTNSPDALQTLIARCGQAAELTERLGSLTALTDQCRDLNRENGSLIQQRQRHTRGALQVLRQTGDTGDTYSGRGKAEAKNLPRTLGKA